jgi:hypothetical protein
MPAEVYSISGFGADGACPEGWAVTPAGNCGAPMGGCPPNFMTKHGACRSALALRLQNALYSLGRTVGDRELAAISVDGFVGQQTAGLLNKAMTTHVGPGQAGADLRAGTLSQADVAARAAQLSQIVEGEVARRGGRVVQKVPVAIGPAKITPGVSTKAPIPGKLWALAGLQLLIAGVGIYGATRKRIVGQGVDLPSHITPFPEAA